MVLEVKTLIHVSLQVLMKSEGGRELRSYGVLLLLIQVKGPSTTGAMS